MHSNQAGAYPCMPNAHATEILERGLLTYSPHRATNNRPHDGARAAAAAAAAGGCLLPLRRRLALPLLLRRCFI